MPITFVPDNKYTLTVLQVHAHGFGIRRSGAVAPPGTAGACSLLWKLKKMRASTNTGTPLRARCAATEGEFNSVNGATSGPLFEALTPPPGVWYEAVLTDMSGKVLSNTVHWPAKAPAPSLASARCSRGPCRSCQ